MEDKHPLTALLENWKVIIGTILIIATTAIALRSAFWEFNDKGEAREKAIREMKTEESNHQLAYFMRKVWKKDMDSLIAHFSQTNEILMMQAIKKDSLLLIVIPTMSRRVNRSNVEVERLNQKFNLILNKQDRSDKVDFLRLLNQRDSLAAAKSRSDSLDMILLREIRKINRLYFEKPKFGDRVK